jgi:hypothetical protein
MHTDNLKDQEYWNRRWENRETGWDIGTAAPAIMEYMKHYPNRNAPILIPGCGNAHEAASLLKFGFTNITLLDIAPLAVSGLHIKFSGFPEIRTLCEDFFEHREHYDLIIEQTFFCAIPPGRRKEYVLKAGSLLNENGKLIGLLFNRLFEQDGPPYGGSAEEYQSLFSCCFQIQKMETCTKSIPPRAGTELFIELIKK